MVKRTGWHFALIALILGGCIYFLYSSKFNLGIDLQGGTELTYQLDLSRIEESGAGGPTPAELIKAKVASRLDIYGLKEISLSIQGTDRMVVQLPGAADSLEVENLKQQIEMAGNLKFMLVAPESDQGEARAKEVQEAEAKYLAEDRAWFQKKREHDGKYQAEGKTPPEFTEPRPQEPEFIARPEVASVEEGGRTIFKEKVQKWGRLTILQNADEYKVSGDFLSDAHATYDENGRPAVAFGFNPEGAAKFANLTGPNRGRLLAIILDENIREMATIRSRIYDRGQLTGSFSQADVRGIVTVLKGGALLAKPKLVSETSVGAVMGHDSIKNGTIAIAAGLLGIFVFMSIYYIVGGLVANFAMCFNVVIILSYVVVFRQTLTFPGIAGVLLTLGMAVDANILIFERVREELGRGKSLLHSLTAGYQRAFWVIFDSNITTILSGVVLFELGTGPVKGFAVTLIAGLVASFFTSVYVTRVILSALYNVGMLKNLRMLKIFSPPRVDFIANRFKFIGMTVSVIALTWIIFVIPRGSRNYGIDFTGGTRISMNLNSVISMAELRGMIENIPAEDRALFKDYSIQTLNSKREGYANSFSLLTRTEEESAGVANAQEKKEEAPPAAPAPAAAPAPPGEPPAAPPKAEEKVAPPPPPAMPPEAPKALAEAPPSPLAPKTGASRMAADQRSFEARRVDVLREMLRRNRLLLPDAFSEPRWVDDTTPGAAPGTQSLEMVANLILPISDEFNKVGDKTLPTHEAMKERLNQFFGSHAPISAFKGDAGTFKWVTVKSVEPIPAPPIEGPGERAIQLASFRIVTNPYAEPLQTSDDTTRASPRHNEVVSELKKWFRDTNLLSLSEPFPEVFSVGPKVAGDLQQKAIVAIFVSLLGIMFYLALRFEFMYGVGGMISLIHDVAITIGIVAMTDQVMGDTFAIKINLPEIAAILTIIGFSINDTIVIFDRIREILKTMKRKIEFPEVINAAVNQTLSRTIWTSLTCLIVTLALLLLGGEPVRGFAFAFAVGIVTGTYSSIFIASPIVLWMHNRQIRRRELIREEEESARA